MSEPLLVANNLSKRYHHNGTMLPVLSDLSFGVDDREFVCMVGPSGCGKTTLLRLIAGLEPPTSGEVRLGGQPVNQPRRAVGLVFQQPTLMDWRTVAENVALPLETNGFRGRKAAMRQRVQSMVDLVGLSGFEEAHPLQLSGGMAQRVALARALVHDPQLLLLDEPFGALDALTRERMAQELLEIWRARRKTVLMVTHSVSEAIFLADRVLVLGPRPTEIVAEASIDLPRPRSWDVVGTRAFGKLTTQVRKALNEVGLNCLVT